MVSGAANRLVTVHHLDAFAAAPGGGNPCPIVADCPELSGAEMQAVAAHYQQETGFVLFDDDGALRFRFFVPRHEMAMCVHATVAAITVLVGQRRLSTGATTVRTASGDCAVSCDAGTPPMVSVEQQHPQFGPAVEEADEVAAALGVPLTAVEDRMPIRAASVSRPKLIVPLRTEADVSACFPDFQRLWTLCRRLEVTGAYVFASRIDSPTSHVVARQFPVDAGYPEDPATGVAAAALAAYLADQRRPSRTGWQHFTIDQGETMGRPSRLQASAFADAEGVSRSTVRGSAVPRGNEVLDLGTLDVRSLSAELR